LGLKALSQSWSSVKLSLNALALLNESVEVDLEPDAEKGEVFLILVSDTKSGLTPYARYDLCSGLVQSV
jgi:hypothetical protein